MQLKNNSSPCEAFGRFAKALLTVDNSVHKNISNTIENAPTKEFAVDNLETGEKFGAGNETRTRDPDLGKVVLYQLSYSRLIYVF